MTFKLNRSLHSFLVSKKILACIVLCSSLNANALSLIDNDYTFTNLVSASSTGLFGIDSTRLNKTNFASFHQQDVRSMLDGNINAMDYELHLLSIARESSKIQILPVSSANAFQLTPLTTNTSSRKRDETTAEGLAKIDRFNIKMNYDTVDFLIGRQAISWGVGRFWQPTDIFGAFDATELVRDYKPGIDVVDFNYYPDDFSNINLIYVLSQYGNANIGMRYSTPISTASDNTYFSIMSANINYSTIGNAKYRQMIGVTIESDWNGAGIRFESVYSTSHLQSATKANDTLYSVAGFDYQFINNSWSNEWIITSEIYFNNRGANQPSDFRQVIDSEDYQTGTLKQLSQQLFAVALQKSITPLISVNYLWINSFTLNPKMTASSLFQLSALYSISNESDIRVTIITSSGNKSNVNGSPQSEFGDVPLMASFLYRLYF